jgi:hypothetical protein
MARIHILLEDLTPTHLDIQIICEEELPDSLILCTNAQQVTKEIKSFLEKISKEINNKNNQEILVV